MDGPKNRIHHLTALVVIVAIGLFFHLRHLKEYPAHIHAWAQADRYALALGFLDNGFDLLHPETFTYNHQFPNDWKTADGTTITAVDPPLHEYAIAGLMKLFGDTGPLIFRGYTLLYGLIGLFFLFKLALQFTGNFSKALFATIFAATSPVFLYYQSGFLPSIPSLANAIIGLFLYIRFAKEERFRWLAASVFFLTLATLTRTTYAIVLGAVLVADLARLLHRSGGRPAWRWPFLLSVAILLACHLHNLALTRDFGSIFLAHFLPARSWGEVAEIGASVKANWLFQYFSGYHYVLLFAALVTAVALVGFRRTRVPGDKRLLALLIILMMGASALFTALMLQQFPAHDYYFLDTFFLPIVLILVLSLALIPPLPTKPAVRAVANLLLIASTVPLLLNGRKAQAGRMATVPWDRTAKIIADYSGSASYLDSLGIPATAKLLVFITEAPNLPFIFLQRKGYALMSDKKEDMINALGWDADLVVFQDDDFLENTIMAYPGITHRLVKVADNGHISICRPVPVDPQRDLFRFMGLNEAHPAFQASLLKVPGSDPIWEEGPPSVTSGASRIELASGQDYAFNFHSSDLSALVEKPRLLTVGYSMLRHDAKRCELVVTTTEDGKPVRYRSRPLAPENAPLNSWLSQTMYFGIPRCAARTEFALYLWNPDGSDLLLEDLRFALY